MIKSDAPFEYEPMIEGEYLAMVKNRVNISTHHTRGRHQALKATHNSSAYTFEYEPITAAEWDALTVGDHKFPRETKSYQLRGRGITRLRFSLRHPNRR